MPPNWKECPHFQKVTQIWKGTALKTKSHPAFTLVTISQESHNSKGFLWHLHLLSHRTPCEQCQPHYSFHVSVLSWGPKKQSSKLQLTGSFPSERVSEEKHSYSKAKIFYGIFFFPRIPQLSITKPEINIYSCLVWPDSDCLGLQKWPEILIFKCISYWVILPLGDSRSEAWMPLQIPCSPLSKTHACFGRIRSIN